MKRGLWILCLGIAACIAAAGERPPDIFATNAVVLFQGDSITHGGRGGDLNHYLGHGYQAIVAQRYLGYRPDLKLEFLNRAVSGDTTVKLLARWEKDAIDIAVTERGYAGAFGCPDGPVVRHPDVLSLLVGVNDLHSLKLAPEAFRSNFVALVTRSLAANPKLKIVLGEPFLVPQSPDPLMAQYQAIAAETAARFNAPLVKYQRLFNEEFPPLNANPRYWSWDGVHPSYAAHIRMADEWIRAVAAFRQPCTNTALVARGKLENDSYDWYARHAKILSRQAAVNPEVVFIGDSITHFWAGRDSVGEAAESTPHWHAAFGGLRVLNMGFGWDRTQNVLWRLDHGEMDGLAPRLVVIHIGTNNIGGSRNARANSPAEIADAIREICQRVHSKSPRSSIVLMGIFPRGEKPDDFWRGQAAAANEILKTFPAALPYVTYLDIGPKLVQADGTISRATMGDFCHPTPAGYAVWADALKPFLGQPKTGD
jgi:lysophospholipase L1-like esterase